MVCKQFIYMCESKSIVVDGILRGRPGETRHVCWQCPECLAWYSDDYISNLGNPYLTRCDWTRKHDSGDLVIVSVKWTPEEIDSH